MKLLTKELKAKQKTIPKYNFYLEFLRHNTTLKDHEIRIVAAIMDEYPNIILAKVARDRIKKRINLSTNNFNSEQSALSRYLNQVCKIKYKNSPILTKQSDGVYVLHEELQKLASLTNHIIAVNKSSKDKISIKLIYDYMVI